MDASVSDNEPKVVYWHRELPPLEAELVGEHTVEADSSHIPGTIAHRDELWELSYRELMAKAESRLTQEVRACQEIAVVSDRRVAGRMV